MDPWSLFDSYGAIDCWQKSSGKSCNFIVLFKVSHDSSISSFQGKVTLKVRGTLIQGPLIIDVGVRSLFLKIASAIIYCFNIKRNIKVDCFTKHSTITITAIKPSLKCWGGFSNRYFQVYDYPALWDSVFDWLMAQSSKHQFETPPDVYCLNKYMHVFRLEFSLFGNIFLWNSMIYTRSWKKGNVF